MRRIRGDRIIDILQSRVVSPPFDNALAAQGIDMSAVEPWFEAKAQRQQRDPVVVVGNLRDPERFRAALEPFVEPSPSPFAAHGAGFLLRDVGSLAAAFPI